MYVSQKAHNLVAPLLCIIGLICNSRIRNENLAIFSKTVYNYSKVIPEDIYSSILTDVCICSNYKKLQMSSDKQQLRNFNEILDRIS